MQKTHRCWCASIQYPDKQPIYLGTVVLQTEAKNHEIEAEINLLAKKHIPDGYKIIRIIPGMIFFDLQEPEKQETNDDLLPVRSASGS
jgi:hypothetical protein